MALPRSLPHETTNLHSVVPIIYPRLLDRVPFPDEGFLKITPYRASGIQAPEVWVVASGWVGEYRGFIALVSQHNSLHYLALVLFGHTYDDWAYYNRAFYVHSPSGTQTRPFEHLLRNAEITELLEMFFAPEDEE